MPKPARAPARAARACAAALLTTLAASCTQAAPEPAPLESPAAAPATPTATATATPQPPPLPPEARGTSEEAAIAFVEHAIDVLNYTAATLETDEWRVLSHPGCVACSRIAESTDQIQTAGGEIKGGAWEAVQLIPRVAEPEGTYQVQTVVDYSRQRVITRSGEPPKRYPAGRTLYTFEVGSEGADWKILEIRGDD
jgi:hypothetical protein